MDHGAYISDKGIYRVGNNFYFHKNKNQVICPKMLARLTKIVVPPAWTKLWYASNLKSHIILHGVDAGGKKQYILSEKWIKNARSEKFNKLKQFIKDIASFKRLVKLPESVSLTRQNIINLLFNLLIDLHIRVGNEIYAEQNKTYGLTTLRQKHLKDSGTHLSLKFVGKSGISHCVALPEVYRPWFCALKNTDRNKPLFYCTEGIITSEDLNNFLKQNMGKCYTCKDFRTYSSNILFIKAFLKNSKGDCSAKKCVLKSIDKSARDLGHTRNISRKSYISGDLIDYCLNSFNEASKSSSCVLLSKIWGS
jgi:DNA topoisomerase-1